MAKDGFGNIVNDENMSVEDILATFAGTALGRQLQELDKNENAALAVQDELCGAMKITICLPDGSKYMAELSRIVRKYSHPNYEKGLRESQPLLALEEIRAYRREHQI